MGKTLIKSCIAMLLALAMLFSATACTIGEVTNAVSETVGETTVGANSGIHFSPGSRIEQVQQLGNKTPSEDSLDPTEDPEASELEPTDKELYVTVKPDEESEREFVEDVIVEGIIKESSEDDECSATEWTSKTDMPDVFGLAMDCVAYDLYEAGYEVFQALAMVGETMVPGLAFTKYEVFEQTEERTVYSCGFMQIVDGNVEITVAVTRDDVEHGVVVVPYGEYDTTTGFLVSLGASIPSYSGICDGYYFRYDQIAEYAVSVGVQPNDRSVWDEEIDLFDFDRQRFVFRGDMSYHGTSATPFFSDEAKAYAAAKDAINKIIDHQNSNAYKAEKQVIIIFTADVVDEFILNSQKESINGFLLDKLNEIEVKENQFLVVTTEGVSVETAVDKDAVAKERLTNGILGFITNALLVAGSVFVAVATCGVGTPLAISAICVAAGVGATLYGVSNMIESGMEIYYGATGNITDASVNPLLNCFKSAIGDDELATKVYHVFGISSSLLQALIVPANSAIALSRAAGATVWQTTLAVTRAVAVEAVKIAVTGLVSAGVGYGANVIVTELTHNENWGKIAGFGSALLTGAFTYQGLNRLDAKYNFSGLHSKGQVLATRKKVAQNNEASDKFSTDNGRLEPYKNWKRDDYINNIDNEKLKSTAEYLYRANAEIGDGGTADAVRYTKQTGKKVGGSDHILKAQETVTHIEGLMKTEKMSYHDLKIAQSLMEDLIHAINYVP